MVKWVCPVCGHEHRKVRAYDYTRSEMELAIGRPFTMEEINAEIMLVQKRKLRKLRKAKVRGGNHAETST